MLGARFKTAETSVDFAAQACWDRRVFAFVFFRSGPRVSIGSGSEWRRGERKRGGAL